MNVQRSKIHTFMNVQRSKNHIFMNVQRGKQLYLRGGRGAHGQARASFFVSTLISFQLSPSIILEQNVSEGKTPAEADQRWRLPQAHRRKGILAHQ